MSARHRASSRAIHTRTPRGGVILDPVTKAYYVLNDTGEVLWKALERGASAGELTRALCDAFEVDEDAARVDTERWLEELVSLGLIETDDAAR